MSGGRDLPANKEQPRGCGAPVQPRRFDLWRASFTLRLQVHSPASSSSDQRRGGGDDYAVDGGDLD
ncbi:hypothetical protein CASFOL_031255 [Castilleja foliolosa]|uniref:Uncharacterized protein n=1 Tax=Castilleja foliolosa TaxID=1961234 RepID=A0ABD3C747_9LAMI